MADAAPQNQEHSSDFDDTYKEAMEISEKAQKAEDIAKTRRLSSEALANETRNKIDASDYSRIMNEVAKLLAKKDNAERLKALGEMPIEDKELMKTALEFQSLMKQLDEETRTKLAEDEIHVTQLEEKLFGDLKKSIANPEYVGELFEKTEGEAPAEDQSQQA